MPPAPDAGSGTALPCRPGSWSSGISSVSAAAGHAANRIRMQIRRGNLSNAIGVDAALAHRHRLGPGLLAGPQDDHRPARENGAVARGFLAYRRYRDLRPPRSRLPAWLGNGSAVVLRLREEGCFEPRCRPERAVPKVRTLCWGPGVRIRFPPAGSLQTLGPSPSFVRVVFTRNR